jgi:hypothetical protein
MVPGRCSEARLAELIESPSQLLIIPPSDAVQLQSLRDQACDRFAIRSSAVRHRLGNRAAR